MEYPKRVTGICRKMARKYGNDIDKAVETAETEIRKLPNFDEFAVLLITLAIRELIADARHNDNLTTRRNTNYDSDRCTPKTQVGRSAAVLKASQSIYEYNIGGKMLGWMTGDEVGAAMETQLSISNGHRANYYMLAAINGKVPGGKQVKDVFTRKQLVAVRRKAENQVKTEAA